MSNPKEAAAAHPINDLLRRRWSPYVLSDQPVALEDLRSLFEAARWSASSYNEQPWRYIVATRDEPAAFADVLSCLVEANQAWASVAPVLAIGVASTRFARNGKPNKAAYHDLGLASASLTLEATARGLVVHQMIGIVPGRAHELFAIPDGFEAYTGLAIAYPGDQSAADEGLAERDAQPRTRRPVEEFVFGPSWGKPSPIL